MDFHQTVCALILWRYGLGLLMGKFCQILMELSARDIFSFPDDNLSKCQGILTKLGTYIDIKKIWFGIANGQIWSSFDRVICPRHDNGGVLSFYVFISVLQLCISCTLFPTPSNKEQTKKSIYIHVCVCMCVCMHICVHACVCFKSTFICLK